MIRTVSQLLEAFLETEREILDKEQIGHPTIVGAMYEGLSKDLLNLAIPQTDYPIQVVSGVLTSQDGSRRSTQTDIIVCSGINRQIPHTSEFEVPIDNAIAIFEVKKTLNRKRFVESMAKLESVDSLLSSRLWINDLLDDQFRALFDFSPIEADIDIKFDNLAYLTAWRNANLPLRIILGYHGLNTKNGLVGAFREGILAKAVLEPWNWPDLVMTRRCSLMKLNGLPYSDLEWKYCALMGSTEASPLLVLLEMLLWRLRGRIEKFTPLYGDHNQDPNISIISAFGGTNQAGQLELRIAPDLKACRIRLSHMENGLEVTWKEFQLLFYFSGMQCIPLNNKLATTLEVTPRGLRRIAARLAKKGIVFIENDTLYSNLSALRCSIDGKVKTYYVGEDVRGRFSRLSLRRNSGNEKDLKILHVAVRDASFEGPFQVAETNIGDAHDDSQLSKLDSLRYANMKLFGERISKKEE